MATKSELTNIDEILRQIAAGSEATFQTLYLHYHDRLFQFARMLLHSQHSAEDVVSELFYQLWKNRASLTDIENFNAYVYCAVRNSCTNYALSGYRLRVFDLAQPQLQVQADESAAADESVDLNLLNEALTTVVDELPERCRLVFKLAKEDGMSHRNIASVLDISVSTVEGQLAIAMQRLRVAATPFLKKN